MTAPRRKYSAEEKVRILRRHLVEKVPVSDLCDELGLRPSVYYRWQQTFFENGAKAFERNEGRESRARDEEVAALRAKLAHKDEVIAEIMEDHVALKKTLGRR